jgi:hypothetical protein
MEATTQTEEKVYTDEELFAILKECPDFERLPLPGSWFKRFNIKPIEPGDFKTYIKEKPWMKAAYQPKDFVEFKEAAPGGLRPIIEVEPVPMEVIQRPADTEKVYSIQNIKDQTAS